MDPIVGVTVSEPALLIRINRSYREGMSALALYEATRGVWKLGPRREGAHLALAVYQGRVVEVFAIHEWHPANSTPYRTRTFVPSLMRGRWEFSEAVAEESVRAKYLRKIVVQYFTPGNQNPVTYVNVD